jgi:hypothetical protein
VFQSFTAKKGKKRCGEKLSLLQLAQGSVMQEFVMKDEKKDGSGSGSAKSGGALFRISFVVYFEELFVFQLRFVLWKGVGLIAADTPKKKKRSAKSEDLESKRKAKIEAAREAFKQRLELKRKQKERNRRMRIDKQRAAQSGGRYLPPPEDGGGTGATANAPAGETGAGAGASDETGGGGGEHDHQKLITGPQSDALNDGASPSQPPKRGWLAALGIGGKSGGGGGGGDGAKKKGKLSFQERVELQKQRDADQKEEQLQREMKRLRRLRKQQDAREEERLDKAKKAEAKRTFDPKEYMAATSDPYIVFSIDPPAHPGCKILRHGGYFGRTVRTVIALIAPNCPYHLIACVPADQGGRYARTCRPAPLIAPLTSLHARPPPLIAPLTSSHARSTSPHCN